jgi:hypothetical protein
MPPHHPPSTRIKGITWQSHPKIGLILSTIKLANKEIPSPPRQDSPELAIAKSAAKIGRHSASRRWAMHANFFHSGPSACIAKHVRCFKRRSFYIEFYFVGFLYIVGTETFFTVENPCINARHKSCSYLFLSKYREKRAGGRQKSLPFSFKQNVRYEFVLFTLFRTGRTVRPNYSRMDGCAAALRSFPMAPGRNTALSATRNHACRLGRFPFKSHPPRYRVCLDRGQDGTFGRRQLVTVTGGTLQPLARVG